MKKFILNLALKFITPDVVAEFCAKLIVKLLKWAREQKAWDNADNILKCVSNLINLWNQVYEDDELTEDDEDKISEAILNLTTEETIQNIIDKIK